MTDLTQFSSVIAAARSASHTDSVDPRIAFMSELTALGWNPPMGIIEGKLQRFDIPQGHKGGKEGWYRWYESPDLKDPSKYFGTGVYGSWNGDPFSRQVWTSKNPSTMTFQEKAMHNAHMAAAKIEQDAEQERIYAEGAIRASEEWNLSEPPKPAHPYIVRKQNKLYGVREREGRIIIPVMANGKIQSLQYIAADGSKRFLTGGKVKGGYFKLEGDDSTVFVAEGYSTGASIREATGNSVYLAFSAGNIYEAVSQVQQLHKGSRIVVCGDDDKKGACVGRVKAQQAADTFNCEVMFPPDTKDFNDAHVAHGLQFIKDILTKKPMVPYEKKKSAISHLEPTCGVLLDIFNYYNISSGNDQRGFAIQTALAVTSVILARAFKSNFEHYPTLYLLNVGKSGTGKEAGKKIAEDLLEATGNGKLIAGDGYTSSGAVMSTLLDRPKHYTAIDEFGRYMAAANGAKNPNQVEANTAIMELFGRCGGTLRPKNYSGMSAPKAVADALKDRYVCSPSLTIMASTTPGNFFENVGVEAVRSGFINRFLMSFSEAERVKYKLKEPVPVPQSIINWAKAIEERNPVVHTAAEDPNFTIITWTQEAKALFDVDGTGFQDFCIAAQKVLEKSKMEELPARSAEIAFRISLIHALSRNPDTKTIELEDAEWAIAYVKDCLAKTTVHMKMNISGSEFEADKKEIMQALRDSSPEWTRYSQMGKLPPFSKHKPKELQTILKSLEENELIEEQLSTGVGRQTKEYRAIK